MLTEKNITIIAKSVIDEVAVITHRAVVTAEEVTFLPMTHDKAAYEQHRVEIRKETAEFEDYAYDIKKQLFAEK